MDYLHQMWILLLQKPMSFAQRKEIQKLAVTGQIRPQKDYLFATQKADSQKLGKIEVSQMQDLSCQMLTIQIWNYFRHPYRCIKTCKSVD